MITITLFFLCLVGSTGITWAIRKYALKNKLVDIPNHRSSHSNPTPRGGGGAIVFTFISALTALFLFENLSIRDLAAIVLPGLIVSGIGFWDDHGHVSSTVRLFLHFFAGILGLSLLGGMPSIEFFGNFINLKWLGNVFAIFYLVWLLNLYNFMDGINGLAGIEAITAGAGFAIICFLIGDVQGAWLCLLLVASVIGFTVWNFPVAKIFMGDVGSGFLGIIFGILSIMLARANPEMFWIGLILLGVFIVDATATLIVRIIRKENFFDAHHNHAYQRASREYKSHTIVSLSVGVINAFWLLPLGIAVALGWLSGGKALIISYLPLLALAARFRSGGVSN